MELKFDENGLIPAIVQDWRTGKVLMMAYMNEESLRISLEQGRNERKCPAGHIHKDRLRP
jgi:phosphoribosyl-AMP cyclohydrolase